MSVSDGSASNENEPSKLDIVPTLEFFTITVAPIIGSPLLSVTKPVILFTLGVVGLVFISYLSTCWESEKTPKILKRLIMKFFTVAIAVFRYVKCICITT